MLRKLVCPHCGAPLDALAAMARDASCAHCGQSFAVGPDVVSARDFRAVREEAERAATERQPGVLTVAGVRYRVLGRLARGESTDVFLAERVTPTVERVVIKVLRAPEDADLLEREERALRALHESEARGTESLSTRIPAPVAFGHVETVAGRGPRAAARRYASGFFLTFSDVQRAYPGGVDPRAALWMWRRILEALAWIHASGWVHGSLVPGHLLVHPRDHGVSLVGFSCAVRIDEAEPPPALVAEHLDLYPEEIRRGGPATPAADLAMGARCVVSLLGPCPPDGVPPPPTPRPLASLLAEVASGRLAGRDARTLHRQVGDVAREVFGPPAYHHFTMPGWP